MIFERNSLGGLQFKGETVPVANGQTALKTLAARGTIEPAVRRMVTALGRISVFHEPDLWNLRRFGSASTNDVSLETRGGNVLSILRRWRDNRADQARYEFVVHGLQTAFPRIQDLDFESAGGTLSARIRRQGIEVATPIASEANGVLQMLILLANVAASNAGGIVAIDEPENGLHPFAQQVFLASCKQWAARNHVTILLATHSTSLLDEYIGSPNAVFVMKPSANGHELPSPLDRLVNVDWLSGFKYGELYSQGEIGSNDDEAIPWSNA